MDNRSLLDADDRADDDDFVESGAASATVVPPSQFDSEYDQQSADPCGRVYTKHLAHRLAPALRLVSRVCTLRCVSLLTLLACIVTVVLLEVGFDDDSVQACTLRGWWQYKQHRTLHFSLETDFSQAPSKAAVIAAMLVSMTTFLGYSYCLHVLLPLL
jgi:hypothetical protein